MSYKQVVWDEKKWSQGLRAVVESADTPYWPAILQTAAEGISLGVMADHTE